MKATDGLSKYQRYRLKNLEEFRRRKREYAKTPEQKRKRAAYARKWRQRKNPEKYLSNFDLFKKNTLVDVLGCWLWKKYKNKDGYGIFKKRLAHRWIFEHLYGQIQRNYEIDHLCKHRSCVNPDHLELVSHQENVRRADYSGNGAIIAEFQRSKTHCPHGHSYSGENLRIEKKPNGQLSRRCKSCDRNKAKKYIKKKKEWYGKEKRSQITQV